MNLRDYSRNRILRSFLILSPLSFPKILSEAVNRIIITNFRFCLLPFAFCLFTFSLFSQTIYTGVDGGDWFTATNWSNGLPANGNDATVPSGKTVVISQALNVNFNIQSFGGISNTSTLTLATNLVSGGLIINSGTLTINSGITLTSSGGINNSGTINNNGNTNSNSVFTNLLGGLVNNNSSWTQQAALTNSGSFCANAGTFTCPQVFSNNAIVKVLVGATFKVDFGGSFTNENGSTLTNGGEFSNLGTFLNVSTVSNTGFFTNNSLLTCNGIFNNESGGSLISTSTININGRINNKLGGTVNNSFNFNVNANGYFDNVGSFINLNTITILLGGTYCNEATGVVTTNFGSSILDGGYLKNFAGGQIAGNGSIITTKRFDNFGLVDAQGGSQITIGDTLNNSGTFSTVNIFTNNGYVLNSGTLNLNSGGTLVNKFKFVNLSGGKFTNAFEFDNKVGATTINNGNFTNIIRVFNDGSFTNNADLLNNGDFFNRLGATLTNTEVIEVGMGSIVNDGTIVNTKSIYLDQCSVFTNRAIVDNTVGTINSSAIVFQRGTIIGNAINKITGYIQTASTSAATICRTSLSTGTDLMGEAKVYGQNPVLSTLGIDSCAGFQYSVEWTPRKVFTCTQVGTTVTGHFTLLVRTGDSLTCTLPITIFDGVAPQFTNCPSDVKLLTANTSEKYSWATIAVTDNCTATPTIVSNIASGSTFNLGSTGIVITASDASNNARDCKFNVTLLSVPNGGTCNTTSAAPTFTHCPANISIIVPFGNAAAVWAEPTVSGACLPIQLTQTSVSGALFPAGLTTVTYTATDVNNKVGTCSFTVNVTSGDLCATDNIAPVISGCPGNIFLTSNTILNGAVAIWKIPTASDNCSAVNLVSSTNLSSGSVFPVGTTNVVYTATDAKNNTSTCSFTINVGTTNPCSGDITPPTITGCPVNITQTTTSSTVAVTWTEPIATDACSPVTVNKSNTPGSNFSIGLTTVTYNFSDKVGNSSTCSFNVTVNNPCFNDTTRPVLGICPANITVNAALGSATATATWINPSATDNCSTPTVASSPVSGSSFNVGINTVTVTATDAKGNKSMCTFTVTVISNPCTTDITPPVLGTCPANITVNAALGNATATATWINPSATDNCSTPTVASSPVSGSTFNAGVNSVTVTATDAKGNKSMCTFSVTVNANPCTYADNINPTIIAPAPVSAITNTGCTATGVVLGAPVTADNCTVKSVTNNAPIAFSLGVTKVTWTVTDGSGNTASAIQTVTVTDNVRPIFTKCPANIYKTSTDQGSCGAKVTFSTPTATDNCSVAISQIRGLTSGSTFPVGTSTVMFKASDLSGNFNTCSFTVTVGSKVAFDPTVCYNILNNGKPIVLDGEKAYLYSAKQTKVQSFKMISLTNGNIQILSSSDKNAKKSLNDDASKGDLKANVKDYKADGQSDWQINCVNGLYVITYQASGYVLTVGATQNDGKTPVVLAAANSGASVSQTWTFKAVACPPFDNDLQSKTIFNLSGYAEQKRNVIDFTTNQSLNTDYYTAEKFNIASGNFEVLEQRANTELTDKVKFVTFYDNSPYEGDNFYRVKSTFLDGSTAYTNVQQINTKVAADFTIFPNPTDEEAWIDLKAFAGKQVTLTVSDLAGKTLQLEVINEAATTSHHFDLSSYSTGLYFIKVQTAGRQILTRKLQVTK